MISDSSEAKLTVTGVPDRPGIAARLFRALADRSINVDMIEQNVSIGGTTDISFTVPHEDLATASDVSQLAAARDRRARRSWPTPTSPPCRIIGAGMKTHPGVSATMFEVLAQEGINIEMISTSSIRLTCVVRAELADNAVVALHRRLQAGGRSRC